MSAAQKGSLPPARTLGATVLARAGECRLTIPVFLSVIAQPMAGTDLGVDKGSCNDYSRLPGWTGLLPATSSR